LRSVAWAFLFRAVGEVRAHSVATKGHSHSSTSLLFLCSQRCQYPRTLTLGIHSCSHTGQDKQT